MTDPDDDAPVIKWDERIYKIRCEDGRVFCHRPKDGACWYDDEPVPPLNPVRLEP